VVSVDVAARFGDNLRRHRKAAGLSQEDTAVLASLHRTAVGQLERGERVARADTIAKLAGALQIDPGKLFEGIVWETGAVSVGRFELPDQDATL
jgi:transcriptional regulator with XRE-family HTH domain